MSVNNWDRRFYEMAVLVSSWSKDPECQVGAVLVSPNKRQFAVGYNGLPRGVEDTVDRLHRKEVRVQMSAHAELNAILNSGADLTGWTLYSTKAPCMECAKAIIQSMVARVVAPISHPTSSWHYSCSNAKAMMEEAGIDVVQLSSDGWSVL